MVQFRGRQEECRLQVYGLQEHHLMVCDALGIDRLWYESPPAGQNSRVNATPP